MARGMKTGGRVRGTPNRRTAELQERLEELGIDPVLGLAHIAKDPCVSAELRARVLIDLMSYIWPKRKALDIASEGAPAISIRLGIPCKGPAPVESTRE
jgi:hypothetical protein